MKINKLILKNMLIAAGLALALGCESKPVTNSNQSQSLTNKNKPNLPNTNAPVLINPLNSTKECCDVCGKG